MRRLVCRASPVRRDNESAAPKGGWVALIEDAAITTIVFASCLAATAMWGINGTMAAIGVVACAILFLITFRWKD